MMNNKWFDVFKTLKFNEKDYDKLLVYVNNHMKHENEIFLQNKNSFITTLPIALKVLSKIKLDNVEFLTSTTDDNNLCGSLVEDITINGVDVDDIQVCSHLNIDVYALVVNEIIDVTTKTLTDIINKDKKIKLYLLYDKISFRVCEFTYDIKTTHRLI